MTKHSFEINSADGDDLNRNDFVYNRHGEECKVMNYDLKVKVYNFNKKTL